MRSMAFGILKSPRPQVAWICNVPVAIVSPPTLRYVNAKKGHGGFAYIFMWIMGWLHRIMDFKVQLLTIQGFRIIVCVNISCMKYYSKRNVVLWWMRKGYSVGYYASMPVWWIPKVYAAWHRISAVYSSRSCGSVRDWAWRNWWAMLMKPSHSAHCKVDKITWSYTKKTLWQGERIVCVSYIWQRKRKGTCFRLYASWLDEQQVTQILKLLEAGIRRCTHE